MEIKNGLRVICVTHLCGVPKRITLFVGCDDVAFDLVNDIEERFVVEVAGCVFDEDLDAAFFHVVER